MISRGKVLRDRQSVLAEPIRNIAHASQSRSESILCSIMRAARSLGGPRHQPAIANEPPALEPMLPFTRRQPGLDPDEPHIDVDITHLLRRILPAATLARRLARRDQANFKYFRAVEEQFRVY